MSSYARRARLGHGSTMMRAISLLLCLLPAIWCSTAAATPVEEFSRFRAVDADGQRIDGERGTWDGQILRGRTREGDPVEVAREDLKLLDVRMGSHATKYATIGGAVGGLLVLAAILEVESDPNAELRTGRAVGVGVGATVLGASIGALAGLQQSKWRNVELGPVTNSRLGPAPPISLALRFDF